MACDRPELADYLTNFTGMDPLNAIVCPFAQSGGGGLGLGVGMVSLFVFGALGLALTVRTQHPGPMLVSGMLVIGAIAVSLPGQAAQIVAVVFLFGLIAVAFMLYRRAQNTL